MLYFFIVVTVEDDLFELFLYAQLKLSELFVRNPKFVIVVLRKSVGMGGILGGYVWIEIDLESGRMEMLILDGLYGSVMCFMQ